MNKERLYLSEEQDQDIDGIISECKENIKSHDMKNYFVDILSVDIVAIILIVVPLASVYLGLQGKKGIFLFGIIVVSIVAIVGIISYFYQNRYYRNRDSKTMNIRKRYELVQKICAAFNLSLTDITAEDVENKIVVLRNLYKNGGDYRNYVFKIMNKVMKYLLGLILSAALAMKGKIVIFIILSLITITVLIIVISMFSCTGPGYEMYRYVKNSFLIPYGHLIDYSIYWLKFLKEELPEIKDYLKKGESMQDIEIYEKEVSIKKFAKVYIEWKNLSSNKEKQVINILKEESDHTIQMLNESKHFKKLSKELDEKLKKVIHE